MHTIRKENFITEVFDLFFRIISQYPLVNFSDNYIILTTFSIFSIIINSNHYLQCKTDL